jgi:pimeloyl-ACP methyl ester carboxylesterase
MPSTSRPPLLLLSGLLCDEEIWADVIPMLDSACTPIAMCFPAYSSIEAMAERVLSEAPPQFALAGHSMGGRVALEVYRRAPARVTGLALLNTGIHPTRSHEAASRGRLVDLARSKGLRALAEEWLPPMLFDNKPPHDPLLVRLTHMVERNTSESFAAQIEALLNRPEAESVLTQVQVPVLLLSATGDTWSPPAQHAAMRELCPGAALVIVAGAGHMSPAEQPAIVAAALRSWLQRVSVALTGEVGQ